ncbi:MAG: NUDIX hydrolase, partial [Beijerinckiaceae bacterium]
MLAASVGVFREGRVLIAERLVEPAKGLYTFPGGRVEMGETLAEAALRELMEEVGVAAEIAGFIDHVETVVRGADGGVAFHAVVCAFAARWVSGEPRSSDEIGQ